MSKPSIVALAMVMADHFYEKDNAYNECPRRIQGRFEAAAEAVRDSIELGVTPGTARRAESAAKS